MDGSSEFDGVVLGESPAGLWAAKQLLAQGFKMLIICTGTANPQNFLPGPIAHDFGLTKFFEKRKKQPLQILTPTHRFRAYQDEVSFRREYEFQFGKKLGAQEQMDASFLRGIAYWARGAETGPILTGEWPALFTQFLETVYFDEAPGFVTGTLLKDLERGGATVVRAGNLQRIFIDRKTFVGIQLANNSKMISVKRAFANTNLDFLNGFLSEPLPYLSEPLGWKFEIQFSCAADALPMGLTDRMIYVEPHAPILEIFQEKPGQFRLSTAVPFQDATLDRSEQRRLAARMLKVCESIIPDLEYNLKKVNPDLRDPERTINIDLPALYPFQELKRVPPELLTYGSGAVAIPHHLLQGLWLTDEEAVPKDSLWGGFESAKLALKSIEASLTPKTVK